MDISPSPSPADPKRKIFMAIAVAVAIGALAAVHSFCQPCQVVVDPLLNTIVQSLTGSADAGVP